MRPGENYYHIVKYKFDVFEEVTEEPEEDEVIEDSEEEDEAPTQVVKAPVDDKDDLLSTKLEENGR